MKSTTVYNNLQKFMKLAMIFVICDLKSEESTRRFEIVSDLSSYVNVCSDMHILASSFTVIISA